MILVWVKGPAVDLGILERANVAADVGTGLSQGGHNGHCSVDTYEPHFVKWVFVIRRSEHHCGKKGFGFN